MVVVGSFSVADLFVIFGWGPKEKIEYFSVSWSERVVISFLFGLYCEVYIRFGKLLLVGVPC